MNFDKITQVNEELAELFSITDKLNHWKTNYLDRYPTAKLLHKYFESKSKEELGGNVSEGLMGELRLPVARDMLIPSLDSPNYGVPLEIRIEYYNWMIHFLAEKRFLENAKPFHENEIKKPLGRQFIKGEFEKIQNIRTRAMEQLKDGKINLYSENDITPEKLYLWYKNKYYSQYEVRVENSENTHVRSVCCHHYIYPYLSELLSGNKRENKCSEILKLTGISISKLLSELIKRKYVDEKDKVRLQNWLKGIIPTEPIHINKPMSHLASLIADLQEHKYIKNNKTFCKDLIHSTLLFDNKIKSKDSIKNALNKNAHTRIHKSDSDNYIDIQMFTSN